MKELDSSSKDLQINKSIKLVGKQLVFYFIKKLQLINFFFEKKQ